jgi:hypothetical protein
MIDNLIDKGKGSIDKGSKRIMVNKNRKVGVVLTWRGKVTVCIVVYCDRAGN